GNLSLHRMKYIGSVLMPCRNSSLRLYVFLSLIVPHPKRYKKHMFLSLIISVCCLRYIAMVMWPTLGVDSVLGYITPWKPLPMVYPLFLALNTKNFRKR